MAFLNGALLVVSIAMAALFFGAAAVQASIDYPAIAPLGIAIVIMLLIAGAALLFTDEHNAEVLGINSEVYMVSVITILLALVIGLFLGLVIGLR